MRASPAMIPLAVGMLYVLAQVGTNFNINSCMSAPLYWVCNHNIVVRQMTAS